MIIVSLLLSMLSIAVGVLFLVFLHNIIGVTAGVFFLLLGGLPFCSWKRGFSRELILYKGKVTFKQNNHEITYRNSEIRAIIVGNHVALYLKNGRRHIIFWVSSPKCDYLTILNPLLGFGHLGDLRIKVLNTLAAVAGVFFLISFFMIKIDALTLSLTILVIAIIGIQFIYWLINYLFFD